MSFKKYNKIRKVLVVILPALIVAALVFSANNIYFDLDLGPTLGRLIVKDAAEFKDMVYLGAMEFAENAGQVSWINLPVGTVAAGTIESYTAQIDSQPVLTVYGEADGSGGVKNLRVGIATTTPAYTLDVYGTFRALSTSTFSGNVGIGTTNPSQKLTVAGNIGIQAGANAFIGTLDNYGLSLRTNNTDAVYITNTGNVGIGTTGPSGSVEIRRTSGDATLHINSASGANAIIRLQSAGTNKWGWLGEYPSAGKMSFYSYDLGNNVLVIQNTGNIGIGTATPSSKLQVSSGSSYFDSLPAPTGVSATATSGGTLAAGTYYYIVFALDANNLPSPASAEVSATVDGSNTNAITISWSAVAGAAKYRVFGRSQGAENQYWETTSTSFTDTGTSGTSGTPPKYGASAYFLKGLGVGTIPGMYKLYVYDNSPQNSYSSYFYISNTNTSGTWYGTGLVHYVAPTANSSAMYEGARMAATSQSGSSYNIGTLIGAEAYGLYYGTGVATNVRGGQFTAYNYSTGTTTYAEAIRAQVVNNGSGTITNAYGLRIIASVVGSGTITNRWGIYQEGTSENNYFAGNVGIGTTTPASKLTVQGDLYISATSTFMGNVGIGNTNPASLLSVGSGGQFQVDSSGDIVKIKNVSYSWPSSQAAGANYVLANNGAGTLSWSSLSSLGAVLGTGTTNYLAKWTDANTLATSTIYDSGTYVAIGTTTSPAKLTVYDSGGNQLRLSYSDAYYADFKVIGGGDLQISPTSGILALRTDGVQSRFQVYSTSTNYLEITHTGTKGVLSVTAGDIEIGTPGSPVYIEEITSISASSASSTLSVTQSGSGYALEVIGTAHLRGGAGKTGLYVDSNGKVGIGTTYPTARLHISTGDLSTTPFQVDIGSGGSSSPLPGWAYRKPITISTSSQALTNYQVSVTLDTAFLISTNKMRSDCGDIRFTDSDASTLLNYWLESGCNSASTKIWVKVPSIPTSTTKTIYVYYGNLSATSQSNGTSTFEFFDDFDDGVFDTNRWGVYGSAGSNESGGILNTQGSGEGLVYSKWYPTSTGSYVFRFKIGGTGYSNASYTIGQQGGETTNTILDVFYGLSGTYYYSGGWTGSRSRTSRSVTTGDIVDVQYTVGTSTWYFYLNGSLLDTLTQAVNCPSAGIGFRTYSTTEYIKVDYVFVRKYNSPDPTASVGTEEPVAPIQTVFYIQNQTGNVGIGTTTPAYKLTVNGDLYVSATSTLGSATSTPVIFGGYVQSNIIPFADNQYTLGLSNYRWANVYAATGTFGGTITIGTNTIQGNATTTLFTSGNANQLVLGATGNVGIGTTTPAAKLTVQGDLYISATSTFMGNVGIGNTNPASLLTVGSGGQFQVNSSGDIVKIKNVSYSWPSSQAAGANYVLANDGSGNLSWLSVPGLGGVTGTGSPGQAAFWTGTSSISGDNNFWWDNTNKRLGIGTNQPTEILHLSKSGTLAIRYQSSSLNPTNTQPYNPSSVVSDSSNGGTVSWASPLNATTSDNQYATSAGATGALSYYLKATNFGFNIPATNTIVGIVVEIERKSSIPPSGTGVVDNTVKLVKGGTVVGDNKADTANAWPTSDTYKSYGGSNDLWGTTWTPSDINTSTFGVVLSVNFYASGPLTAYVDHIRVTVYYAASGETNWLAGIDSQDSGKFKLSASSSLTSNTVLTLTPSGYVGIGTTTPSRLLTIDAGSTSTVALGVMGSANFTGVVNQNSGGVDIAEAFPIDQNCYKENKCPEVGEVVSISENRTIEKATLPYDSKLLGVVSGNAGIIMWGGFDATSSRLVALAGRVPVKVSTENGPIFAGDPLTAASSTPGVAMKATRAGRVIGIALEDYQGKEVKEVMMLVNPHWLGNDLTVKENENEELVNTYTEQLRVGLSSLGLLVNVNGELEVQKLTTEKLCLKENGEAICITKEQFRELLEKNQINPEVVKENSSTESSSTEAVTSTTSESSSTTSESSSTTSENSSTTSENSTTVASSTE
jgi:hypothetical protein